MPRRKMVTLFSFGIFCALVFFPRAMMAQGLFGSISGIVTDPSGAIVPNAAVTVTNERTNVAVEVKTNGAGLYSVTSLIPGIYKVVAEVQGFKTAVAADVLVDVNANPKVDLRLAVGQVNEVVEI